MTLLLYSLAVWRATSMIIQEDGPAYIFARLRQAVGANEVGELSSLAKGITCPFCVSFWVSAWLVALAIFFPRVARVVTLVLGLSAGGILVHSTQERLTK